MLVKCLSSIGSVWMGFLLYMVLLLVVFDVAGIFIPVLKHSLRFAFPLTLCIMCCGYINYRHPRAEQIILKVLK